ncbi:UNVERIFIED_CONTAM: hypothetical protein GTU68_037816 [Idotea baltica]|nr:hypothetical protein [Idotea baltica]
MPSTPLWAMGTTPNFWQSWLEKTARYGVLISRRQPLAKQQNA